GAGLDIDAKLGSAQSLEPLGDGGSLFLRRHPDERDIRSGVLNVPNDGRELRLLAGNRRQRAPTGVARAQCGWPISQPQPHRVYTGELRREVRRNVLGRGTTSRL